MVNTALYSVIRSGESGNNGGFTLIKPVMKVVTYTYVSSCYPEGSQRKKVIYIHEVPSCS